MGDGVDGIFGDTASEGHELQVARGNKNLKSQCDFSVVL